MSVTLASPVAYATVTVLPLAADKRTVNTASRMESHGTPDRIQITRATYELIKDEFECEYRGTVPVKGKGDMETWYLIARLDERRVSGRQPQAHLPGRST